jgi:sucrose phosphorylase
LNLLRHLDNSVRRASGIPQVYYVGLLAGRNDMTLLARTGMGGDINRHYSAADDVQQRLGQPVDRTPALLRLRNTHPAFAGVFDVSSSTCTHLVLTWSLERNWIRLDVDLIRMPATVASSPGRDRGWQSRGRRTKAVFEALLDAAA